MRKTLDKDWHVMDTEIKWGRRRQRGRSCCLVVDDKQVWQHEAEDLPFLLIPVKLVRDLALTWIQPFLEALVLAPNPDIIMVMFVNLLIASTVQTELKIKGKPSGVMIFSHVTPRPRLNYGSTVPVSKQTQPCPSVRLLHCISLTQFNTGMWVKGLDVAYAKASLNKSDNEKNIDWRASARRI